MRAAALMGFWLAAFQAASQVPDWSVQYALPGGMADTREIIETPDGFLLLCSAFGNDSTQSHLVSVSPSGEILGSRRVWPGLKRLGWVDAAAVTGDQAHDLMGIAQDTLGNWSIVRYRVDASGGPVDSALTELPGTSWVSFDNTLRLASGSLIVPAARTGLGEPPFLRLSLLRFAPDATLAATAEFMNPYNMLLARGIAEIAPDTFILATDGGLVETGQWGNGGAFTEFSADLAPITGFSDVIVDDDMTDWNWLSSAHSVHPLPSGDLILSGRYALHAAVARTGRDGQVQHVYLPDGEAYSNYPAVLGGVAMLGDNELLFTLQQNFGQNINDIWAPYEPDVVKVYHLDTLLNEKCVLTLDDHAENAFHWVNRAVATSDGGFVLVGGRRDFGDQPPRWRCWAQKYPPGACIAGLAERSLPGLVRVFPNPGSNEVMFSLSGPDRAARVELLDLQGRAMGSSRFRMGLARLDTGDWPSGMYAYRVLSGEGSPIGSGRWVKE